MLILCIVTTFLLGILTIMFIISATMSFLTYEDQAGFLGLFAVICCALAIVNIWVLYCN